MIALARGLLENHVVAQRLFDPRPVRPRMLVHKPTFACPARCVGCHNRQRLHRASRKRTLMTLDEHLNLYHQAAQLGVRELHISGGEPTLYRHLTTLIEEGRRLGWYVMLNTNGYRLADQSFVDRLFDAGLNGVFLSIYGADATVADRERGRAGLWARAVEGLLRLHDTRRYLNPRFLIVTQSVLSRSTILGAAELLRLTTRLGSDLQVFSYLEGDFEAQNTPTVEQVARFRDEQLPQMLAGTRSLHPLVRPVARCRIMNQFSNRRVSDEQYAAGVYKPTRAMQRACRIPDRFILVLPDGDVHPCNLVEYDHEPVMGNFRETADLRAIWEGKVWTRFRREHHRRCGQCPMGQHNWIPLNVNVQRALPYLRSQQ